MITVMTPGQYRVTAPDGTLIGTVEGNTNVGFQACTSDGRGVGSFPTLAEALKSLNPDFGQPVRSPTPGPRRSVPSRPRSDAA
jgi:hypothetical protein